MSTLWRGGCTKLVLFWVPGASDPGLFWKTQLLFTEIHRFLQKSPHATYIPQEGWSPGFGKINFAGSPARAGLSGCQPSGYRWFEALDYGSVLGYVRHPVICVSHCNTLPDMHSRSFASPGLSLQQMTIPPGCPSRALTGTHPCTVKTNDGSSK